MRTSLSAIAIVCASLIAACGKPDPATPAAGPVATKSDESAAESLPRDPCSLLDADALSAFPGVLNGRRQHSDEAYGISTCAWNTEAGVVTLQTYGAGPGALVSELRAAALEIVDLKRPNAMAAVRLEPFQGIGDQAGGFTESVDAGRGVRRAGALVMVQKGQRLAVLRAPELARKDRKQALATLRILATRLAETL